MSTKFKKFTKALFLFATLLMISCSDDLYEHGDKKNESGYKISDKSLKELSSEKKFLKAFTELNASKSSNSKTVMEQNYNFTISDIPAKVIEKNGNTSYSFYIERDTTNYAYFENLIVGSDSLNQTKAYIAKYKKDFTKPSLINNVPFKSVSITPIIYNDNQSSKVIDCVTKVYSLCNGDPYDCGGAICGFSSFTYCSGGGGPSVGTGVSWGGGGTATTPVSGGAGSNMEKFITSLGFNQQEWFGSQSSQTQQSVFNYLNTNGFTSINKNKINNLINVAYATNTSFVIDPSLTSTNAQVFSNTDSFQNYLNSNNPLSEIDSFDPPSNQNGHKAYFRFKLTSLSGVTLIGNVIDINGTSTINSVTSIENGIYVMSEWEQSGEASITTLPNGNIKIIVVGSIKSNAIINAIGLTYSSTYELTAIYDPIGGGIESSSCIKIKP